MNLIEQLGGCEIKIPDYECYQYHKESLETYEATKHLSVFGMTAFRANLVHNALLKYRRKHNIYEAGDLVVMVDADDYSTIFKVIGKPQRLYHLQGNDDLFYGRLDFQIRHATDEEIEAGHRL